MEEIIMVSFFFTPMPKTPLTSEIDFAPLFLLIIWRPLTFNESLTNSPLNNL